MSGLLYNDRGSLRGSIPVPRGIRDRDSDSSCRWTISVTLLVSLVSRGLMYFRFYQTVFSRLCAAQPYSSSLEAPLRSTSAQNYQKTTEPPSTSGSSRLLIPCSCRWSNIMIIPGATFMQSVLTPTVSDYSRTQEASTTLRSAYNWWRRTGNLRVFDRAHAYQK